MRLLAYLPNYYHFFPTSITRLIMVRFVSQKEKKTDLPDPSQMQIIKKKTLICATEHVCACLYVPGGDFNPSVVTSLLWSCLCGVAICSVPRSSTRHVSLFLSPTVPCSTCTLILILCFFSFRLKFSILRMSFYFRLSEKCRERTLEPTETHLNECTQPLISGEAAHATGTKLSLLHGA